MAMRLLIPRVFLSLTINIYEALLAQTLSASTPDFNKGSMVSRCFDGMFEALPPVGQLLWAGTYRVLFPFPVLLAPLTTDSEVAPRRRNCFASLRREIFQSTRCLIRSATFRWRPAVIFDLESGPLPAKNHGRAQLAIRRPEFRQNFVPRSELRRSCVPCSFSLVPFASSGTLAILALPDCIGLPHPALGAT